VAKATRPKGHGAQSDLAFRKHHRLSDRLVIFSWLLSLFGASRFADLSDQLKDDDFEGFDENGEGKALAVLLKKLKPNVFVHEEKLRLYDSRIFTYSEKLAEDRPDFHGFKYFQYLTLLFSEIYLDAYFNQRQDLLAALNQRVQQLNADLVGKEHVAAYDSDTLTKLALWLATGAGKTLLMHANIWQYVHYYRERHSRSPDNIYLITPNEGLSRQHFEELRLSGFQPLLFGESQYQMGGNIQVEILEITRLDEEKGIRRVAVESLEGDNLVLVDEGHRGASGDKWIKMREQIAERGFTFEYSATFGQIIQLDGSAAYQTYTRGILFDYSYHHFYHDGFGKDFRVLNLPKVDSDANVDLYLTAALLTFYEQTRIFVDFPGDMSAFHLEKPLLILVGSSVVGKKNSAGDKATLSDIAKFLIFLQEFLKKPQHYKANIEKLITGKTSLLDDEDVDIFADRFGYLKSLKSDGETIYRDMLTHLFHVGHDEALIVAENLKGHSGEIILTAGTGDPFGVINVGDETGLLKILEENGIKTGIKSFGESAFHGINKRDTSINMLIGAKKFMEGWSSWRISTMGLLNVGHSEGAQIIQLFGRGVRLHGYANSLRRSNRLNPYTLDIPDHSDYLPEVETLSIFGIKANYMNTFRRYVMEESGVNEIETIEIPTIFLEDDDLALLKTIGLKREADFNRLGRQPVLDEIGQHIRKRPIELDWYPHLEMTSGDGIHAGAMAQKNQACFTPLHIFCMDMEKIHRHLLAARNEKKFYNLLLPTPEMLGELLCVTETPWYILYVRPEMMSLANLQYRSEWEKIAELLLVKLMVRLYGTSRHVYEKPNMRYVPFFTEQTKGKVIARGAESLIAKYVATVEKQHGELIQQLKNVSAKLKKGDSTNLQADHIDFITFDRHLYRPVVFQEACSEADFQPGGIPDSERQFLLDLKALFASNPVFLQGAKVFVLKNLTKGKGVGFLLEDGNFFPDFIVWTLKDGRQYITFVDPKGLVHLYKDHPKIKLHETIKEIEKNLNDATVVLNSIIVTPTTLQELRGAWGDDQLHSAGLKILGVYLMEESDYLACALANTLDHGKILSRSGGLCRN